MTLSTLMAPLDAGGLSDMLSKLARKHQVPGAQLAIHQAGQTVTAEVGELEQGTGRLVDVDSAFPVGSITKSFTATVAMMLVADDDLELDAPVGTYLPELGNGPDDVGAQLTSRQLLSHTSGLADGPGSTEIAASSIRRFVLDYFRRLTLVLPPGTRFSYSNVGYILVGHLIEVITRMTWWDAIESMLLRPLGIEPTFLVTPDPLSSGRALATGHAGNPLIGRIRPVQQSLALAEAPNGGLAMSAVDLVNFGLIQLDSDAPALLPPEHTQQMRQGVPGADPFDMAHGWGLGLALFSNADTVWVGHDGCAEGTACYIRIEPASGSIVVCTCNATSGVKMWDELAEQLAREGLPIGNHPSIKALGQPTALPPDCVGSYLNGDTELLSVVAGENGDLSLDSDGELLRLALHEGLVYSVQDLTSGEWIPVGRFLQNPVTGDLDLIQTGGRIARRHARGPTDD